MSIWELCGASSQGGDMFEKSAQASETIFIAVVALLVLYEIVRWNIPWTRWRVIRIVLGVCLLFGLFLARLK